MASALESENREWLQHIARVIWVLTRENRIITEYDCNYWQDGDGRESLHVGMPSSQYKAVNLIVSIEQIAAQYAFIYVHWEWNYRSKWRVLFSSKSIKPDIVCIYDQYRIHCIFYAIRIALGNHLKCRMDVYSATIHKHLFDGRGRNRSKCRLTAIPWLNCN